MIKNINLPCLIMTIVVFISSPAYSFNPKTHVWVGQQVLNDVVPDGKVTIPPFGEFLVDSKLAAVLSMPSYQRVYLMGNIGPDGFPDILGGQLTAHPGIPNGWQTDYFLEWLLVNASSMPNKVFSRGYAAHIGADIFSHTYVNTYAGDIFILTDGEMAVEERHSLLEKYISNHLPPLRDHNGILLGEAYDRIALDDELPVPFLRDTLIRNQTIADQYDMVSGTKHLWAMNEVRRLIAQMYDDTPIYLETPFASLYSYINDELDARVNELISLKDSLEDLCPVCSHCIVHDPILGCLDRIFFPCPSCDPCDYDLSGTCDSLDSAILHLQQQKDMIDNEITWRLALLRERLRNWRDGIDLSLSEYIKTSGQVIRDTMMQDGDPLGKLTDWINCYGPAFAGGQVCTLQYSFDEVLYTIDELLSYQVPLYTELTDAGEEAFSQLQEMRDAISDIIQNRFYDIILDALLGEEENRHIQSILTGNPDDAAIDYIFSRDETGKGLLIFDQMMNPASQRIKADMHLDASGYLDPENFNALYDSIILAKLALLDADQLNMLASLAGVANGANMYSGTLPFNILIGAVRSIDGNHQWLSLAPEYPRRAGYIDPGWPDQRHYGYEYDGEVGFKFWSYPEAREKVFLKIFHGPLVPGVEAPQTIGFPPILPGDYPYLACNSNPFPRSYDDRSCVVEWLVPILSILN